MKEKDNINRGNYISDIYRIIYSKENKIYPMSLMTSSHVTLRGSHILALMINDEDLYALNANGDKLKTFNFNDTDIRLIHDYLINNK